MVSFKTPFFRINNLLCYCSFYASCLFNFVLWLHIYIDNKFGLLLLLLLCHRCHFSFSPFDLGTAFTHFSILELLAAEHFTFVITRPAFIISFAFISKNIPSIKIVSSLRITNHCQERALISNREPCLFNLAWRRFYFTSRN